MRIAKIIVLILVFQSLLNNAQGQSVQRPELVVQTGHIAGIRSLAFSPDGKILASGSGDNTIKLWNFETGEEIRTLTGHHNSISLIVFSRDGELLASAADDDTIKVWNVASGEIKKNFNRDASSVWSLAFSSDSRLLASGGGDGAIKIWDLNSDSSQAPRLFDEKHTGIVSALSFSPVERNLLVSGSGNGFVKIWDATQKKSLRTIKESRKDIHTIRTVAFSSDGKNLLTGSEDGTVKSRTVGSYALQKKLNFNSEFARDISISSNAKTSVIVDKDSNIKLWNLETRREIKFRPFKQTFPLSIALSPSGNVLAVGNFENIKLKDISSGDEKNLKRQTNSVIKVAFSASGKALASVSGDGTTRIWSLKNSQQIYTFPNSDSVTAMEFSPDGEFLASGNSAGIIKVWNLKTGKTEKNFAIRNPIVTLAYSADGKALAVGDDNRNIYVWNTEKNKLPKLLSGHKSFISSVAFNPVNKNILASSSGDRVIKFWEVETGEEIFSLEAGSTTMSLEFSADGKFLVAGNLENKIKLFDVENRKIIGEVLDKNDSPTRRKMMKEFSHFYEDYYDEAVSEKLIARKGENGKINVVDRETGRELTTLIAFNEKDWLAVTPNGLFDGSPSALKQIIWRFDNDTLSYAPIEAFFKEFYYPELLQEIAGDRPPLPPSKNLSQIDIRQPIVKITEINNRVLSSSSDISVGRSPVKVKVEITENTNKGRKDEFPLSSGARDVRLFRNGSLVKLWEKDVFELTEKDGCRQIPAAAEQGPRKAVCEADVAITADKNEFTAYAFNHDNVKSNDAAAQIKGTFARRAGKLQILAVGINEYQNKKHNLKFAEPDAVDFSAQLRAQQINLNNYITPEIIRLTNFEATKKTILYALEKLAKGAQAATKPDNLTPEIEKKLSLIEKMHPEDVLVIYFAGHGTANKDRFYLIPTDGFPTASLNDKARINFIHNHSISDLELELALRDLDAGQLLLIVDACNSGQALEAEEKRRGPMNSKGLAQLAFEKGMYILTAAQSYQAAWEIARTPTGNKVEHGLLTFSLLEGMIARQADIDKNNQVTEREWFGYAISEVPRIQLEEMQKRSDEIQRGDENIKGRDSEVIFLNGDDPNKSPKERSLQTPRVFYRREVQQSPLIITKLAE